MELSEQKVSHCLSFLSLPAPTLYTAPTQSGNKISHKIRLRLDLSRLPVLHFLRPQTHFFIKKILSKCNNTGPNGQLLVLQAHLNCLSPLMTKNSNYFHSYDNTYLDPLVIYAFKKAVQGPQISSFNTRHPLDSSQKLTQTKTFCSQPNQVDPCLSKLE